MKRHVTLSNFADLQQYGLNPLTGEACVYAHRVLFDLSKEGAELVSCYLGLPLGTKFLDNYNPRVGDAVAVGSVMLSRTVVRDLMIFVLWQVGDFDFVLDSPNGFTGFNRGDQYAQTYLDGEAKGTTPAGYKVHHNLRKTTRAPHVGDRNVHQMSGRVE